VASKKHELIGILLSDPGEFLLPEAGIVSVHDLETGEVLTFDASDRKTRNGFRKQKKMEYQNTLEALKAADIDCIEINTAGSAADSLTRYFELRKKRM